MTKRHSFRFYRVNYYVMDPSMTSTEWATSKREAERIARENRCGDYEATITVVEIGRTKDELLEFLNNEIWQHHNFDLPYR